MFGFSSFTRREISRNDSISCNSAKSPHDITILKPSLFLNTCSDQNITHQNRSVYVHGVFEKNQFPSSIPFVTDVIRAVDSLAACFFSKREPSAD